MQRNYLFVMHYFYSSSWTISSISGAGRLPLRPAAFLAEAAFSAASASAAFCAASAFAAASLALSLG